MAIKVLDDIERGLLVDARSGLTIIRLTHGPTISTNLYFEMCSFTDDDSHLIFVSQRYGGRGAPWDLMRARSDGMELVQLTDCDDLFGIVMSPKTGYAYYQAGKEIHRIDVLGLTEEVVAEAPSAEPVYLRSTASIDLEGRYYVGNVNNDKGGSSLFVYDTTTGKVEVIYESDQINHLHMDPAGTTISFGNDKDGKRTPFLIGVDGSNPREYPFYFAHHTWFGMTGKMQGPTLPPKASIVVRGENDAEPETLTEGRYYWHSSPSRDAQWIIADTNWPHEGLYLLHVPTRTVNYVCDTKSSCSHPQWSHPHPSLSPNMKYVLFNSDMTGVGQVYVCVLTDEFLEEAAQGWRMPHPMI